MQREGERATGRGEKRSNPIRKYLRGWVRKNLVDQRHLTERVCVCVCGGGGGGAGGLSVCMCVCTCVCVCVFPCT